jgi:hypothetical protein
MKNRISLDPVLTWDNVCVGLGFHAACAATWAAMLVLGLWGRPEASTSEPAPAHPSAMRAANRSETANTTRAAGRNVERTRSATLAGFDW